MTGHSFVPLPGSERGSLPESQELGAVDDSQRIEVTLVTRRRAPLPRDLVEGPDTLTRRAVRRAARHRPGRPVAHQDRAGRARPGGHRGRRGRPPGQGARARSPRCPRRSAPSCAWSARPDPVSGAGHGRAPVPRRRPADPGRAGRHRARGAGPGRPAAGPARSSAAPRPPRPAPGPAAHPARAPTGPAPCAGPGRGAHVLHAAAGGRAVPVPGGHRRDRARPSRSSSSAAASAAATWIPTSPGWASRCPRSPRPAWTARSTQPGPGPERRRRRGAAGHRGGRRGRPRARRRWSTSRPTPTRASWTR